MNHYYNVAPRYTGGSPAMVDQRTAERVAADELAGYERALSGFHGPEDVERAKALGLRGIAEAIEERADCWLVTDLITGQKYVRMFPESLRRGRQANSVYRFREKYHLPTEDQLKG